MNLYNDNDRKLCEWLKNLTEAGLLPDGVIDSRSIAEIQPDEVRQYRQAHFFAGIGGWPLALSLAGWPEDWPVWTGSVPCQPFSVAGKRKGTADERHLWPAFRHLIAECRPPVVFGEQVASKDGRLWLAGVRSDLEAMGYAVGAADLCAASCGAPHIRQRLWWVAIAEGSKCELSGITRSGRSGLTDGRRLGLSNGSGLQPGQQTPEAARHGNTLISAGDDGGMGHASGDNQQRDSLPGQNREGFEAGGSGGSGGLGDTASTEKTRQRPIGIQVESEQKARRSSNANYWSQFDLIGCSDGKARRVESGTFPLASRIPGRVVKLRAYGNAICPPLAKEFIQTVMEYLIDRPK